MLVSPLAPQGDIQYEREDVVCNLTGAAGGRSVHFHCHGQHPLQQEHRPGREGTVSTGALCPSACQAKPWGWSLLQPCVVRGMGMQWARFGVCWWLLNLMLLQAKLIPRLTLGQSWWLSRVLEQHGAAWAVGHKLQPYTACKRMTLSQFSTR